jgi:hypothetical protein
MVKFDIMNIRKVFPVEGFRYKISVYSVYEPLINFVLLKNLYALLYFAGLKLTHGLGTIFLGKCESQIMHGRRKGIQI